jgi:hypothetical protein
MMIVFQSKHVMCDYEKKIVKIYVYVTVKHKPWILLKFLYKQIF